MSSDTTGDEQQPRRGGLFVQILLWGAFWFFTIMLALEWAIVFLPIQNLPSPYAEFFVSLEKFRLRALELLPFTLPLDLIDYLGIVFSLGGLSISLMTLSARQAIMSYQSSKDLASHDRFGALTVVEIGIGTVVAIALSVLAADMANIGLTSGRWAPSAIPLALTCGLVLTAWFAAYVRVGPLRFNPLRWILAALGVSYAMTLL